jgi:hypothetical protein
MQKIPYKAPEFDETSFNCPFCNSFAKQEWHKIGYSWGGFRELNNKECVCICSHCEGQSIWRNSAMIFPNFQGIEPPNKDLDLDIQSDYIEAAEILQRSPRGSAALLRLSIQKLCVQLGERGGDINKDIGNLVKKGLPVKVQESLDVLRVIGNEAVHPGEMNLRDNIEIASSLFKLVNFIAEKMITEPKEIEEIYNKIPESKKEQIKKRDN